MDFPPVGRFDSRATCTLTPALRERLDAIVAQHDSTLSAVMRRLIEAGLEVYDAEGPGATQC